MKQKKEFLKIIELLIENKKILIITFFISLTASLIISFLLPKWYESKARVLYTKSQGFNVLNIESLIGDMPFDFGQPSSLGLIRLNTIFNSKTFCDSVIERFQLDEVYGTKYRFQTIEELQKHLIAEVNYKDHSIRVIFEYKIDPLKAYEICTYILQKVNDINSQLESNEAKINRIYLENIYNEALKRLKIVEDSLISFQEKYGIYLLDEQMKATIETQAVIEQQLLQFRIQYEYLSQVLDKQAPALKELKLQINTIVKILEDKQNEVSNFSLLLPLKSIPDKGIEYYKLKREIEIISKTLEYIIPQYEKAKIEENQSKPTFIILDPPNIPEYKSRPKRSYIVIGVTSLALVLLFVYILIIDSLNSLKTNDPLKHDRIKAVFKSIGIKIQ